jgi:hypothetical protein
VRPRGQRVPFPATPSWLARERHQP